MEKELSKKRLKYKDVVEKIRKTRKDKYVSGRVIWFPAPSQKPIGPLLTKRKIQTPFSF